MGVRWNVGRQGKEVNIDMKRSGSFAFSYEVTYKNHCPGHMLYKVSAPAPVFSNPELKESKVLWTRLCEKTILRVQDLHRSTGDDGDDAEVERPRPLMASMSQSQLSLPPLAGSPLAANSFMSKSASIGDSMNALNSSMEEWCSRGKGCWINWRQYGPRHSPPNDNCGRWRQLKN